LGCAEYPDSGPDEGYTFAKGVDASRDWEDLVSKRVQEAAIAVMKRMEDEKR
jgi:hypothetical protein